MNEVDITSNKVVSNMIWRFFERFGAQIVTFIVSIVLARIFANNRGVYGTIAIVTAITTILQVFVDSGLGSALIQKKDADQLDFSTVFWFNSLACIVLYIALFFCAPLISKIYKGEDLTWIIRVLGLTIVISGVKNVLQAYISKNMMFKKFFFATLGGTICAAIAGIVFAIKGFGVWALVAQHLINLIIDTIIIWLSIRWKPSFAFSFTRFKSLFKFGWKLLVSSLIDTGYKELKTFVIGFRYTDIELAEFNRGQSFPHLVVTNVNSAIDSVLLPTFSAAQNKKEKVRAMTRRSIKTSSFIMFPIMVGLAVCASQIVTVLLSDAWKDCVPYIQVFCVTFAFYPIHTSNLNAIKSLGRSDLFLKLEIIKKIIGIISILIAMWFGVFAIAAIGIITSIIAQLLNSSPNKKLLNYSYKQQLRDILPQFLLSIFMGLIVYGMGVLGGNTVRVLIVQIVVGVFIYIGGAYIFKFECFLYLLNFAKQSLKRGKQK